MKKESSDVVTAKTLLDRDIFSSLTGSHFPEDPNPFLTSQP